MGANHTHTPPSLLAQPLRALGLHSTSEKSLLGATAWLSTQSNLLASPEPTWVTASRGPPLPVPGVTRIPQIICLSLDTTRGV